MASYDVFISYRHGDPERSIAVSLDSILRDIGFVVALDERVFSPQETFLDEMARCVKESRFTLILLSRRYLESFNTLEEAVMQRCLDNAERKRRLIPLYLEACDPPLWIQSLVGIRLYDSSATPRPLEKLVRVLSGGSACANQRTRDLDVEGRVALLKAHLPDLTLPALGGGLAAIGILGIPTRNEAGLEAARAALQENRAILEERVDVVAQNADPGDIESGETVESWFSMAKRVFWDLF